MDGLFGLIVTEWSRKGLQLPFDYASRERYQTGHTDVSDGDV